MGRIRTLVALCSVLAAAFAVQPVSARTDGSANVEARNGLEQGLLLEINALRRRHGLVPLRLSTRLNAAADNHSAAMGTRGFFAHESADGTMFWKRVERFYPRTRYWSVGENLLFSSPTIDAREAVRAWVASPPHKRNLLTARWREVGLSAVYVANAPGVFQSMPTTIVTADFGVRR